MNPIVIEPQAFYREGDLAKALGLGESALQRARKVEGLRFIKRGHLVLYRGADLLDWLSPDDSHEHEEAARCA